MTCTCYEDKIKNLKEKLPGILKEKDSRFLELDSVLSPDLIVSFDGSDTPPFHIDIEAGYRIKQKNEKIVRKTMPVRLTPEFCPFCSKKYDEEP